MEADKSRRLNALLALAAGFATLLSVFYYLQQISYYLGESYGVIETIKAYNITAPPSSLATLLSASGALSVGIYIIYMMLPFEVIIFAIGIVWLFERQFAKREMALLGISSFVFLLLTAVLEFNFNFGGAVSEYYVAYIGAVLGITASIYPYFYGVKRAGTRRRAYPIGINPETPYTNMLILSNKLMKRLSGELRILDQHFDARGVENLARLIGGNEGRYSGLYILSKGERFGKEFERAYYDLKEELKNRGVELEVRLMSSEDAQIQHERLIMDGRIAYKIPPLNIINKKSEHIVGVNHGEAYSRFEKLWGRSLKYENA